jgi:hypothetical protein
LLDLDGEQHPVAVGEDLHVSGAGVVDRSQLDLGEGAVEHDGGECLPAAAALRVLGDEDLRWPSSGRRVRPRCVGDLAGLAIESGQ